MSCEYDYTDYEASKAVVVQRIESQLADIRESLREIRDVYEDSNGEVASLLREFALELGQRAELKLNLYSYDDIYHNRCGDRDGTRTELLTYASFDEIKQRMNSYAKECVKKGEKYCHHEFLSSLTDLGILHRYSDDLSDAGGDFINYEERLNSIKEKDMFSAEEYAEILAKREADAKAKKDAEAAAVKAKQEQQERDQYEKLRAKFG